MSSRLAPAVTGFVHTFCVGEKKKKRLETLLTEKVAIDEVTVQWVPKSWPTFISPIPFFSGYSSPSLLSTCPSERRFANVYLKRH